MEEKVMKLLLEACDDNIICKNKDIDMFETGLLDSMGFIELLVTLEEEFRIEIDPSEIHKEEMNTPNQLIRFIGRKIHG